MNPSDKEKFANAFLTLCAVFEKMPSDIITAAYFKAMGKHDISDVEQALSRAIVECKFFPKPVELLEFISGKIADVAEVEAGKVLSAIKRVGGHESVAFDNATTQAVISQGFGGWNKLCDDLRADGEQWFLKDFARIYQAYARQGIALRGVLPGRSELTNSSAGYVEHIREPVLIGDQEKSKQIASGPSQTAVIPMSKKLKALSSGIGC